jgi:hypothetical protein
MAIAPGTPEPITGTVLSILQMPANDPKRLGQTDTIITYQISPQHIFQVRIPKATVTTADVDAAIKQHFATVKPILGRTVNLG